MERVFLLGQRTANLAMRALLCALRQRPTPPTLFDRLRFIVSGQEWEHLVDTFWLKQGLVRARPLPCLCSCFFHPCNSLSTLSHH